MSEVKLTDIHGKGLCHICGKPKAAEGAGYCSYPHAMLPVERVGETNMWSWEKPAGRLALEKEGGE